MLGASALLLAALLGAANANPCDIYAAGGTPCVAAHSTVRALYSSFTGPMYQVQRGDGSTKDITPKTAGGIADAAAQDAFCQVQTCVMSIIYDQSGKGNHLTPAPPGSYIKTPDKPVVADRYPITIGGQKAYAVWIESGMGYRNDKTHGVPTGDQSEAIYMIADGQHTNAGCCFDYGNAETNNADNGAATMETAFLGTAWKLWGYGVGDGPFVMADLENGVYGCANQHLCQNIPSVNWKYVVAMIKGYSGGNFGIKQGDATKGGLQTTYDGPRPDGYRVMKKEGAIILGIGGDNSDTAVGTFYEGCMVAGSPSNSVDDQVQADIVAAGYGKSQPGPTSTSTPSPTTKQPTTQPTTTKPASGGAALYGQCGGIGWNGPTTCAQGTCKKLNDYYSQCV